MSKFAALKLSTTKSRGVDDEGVMIERFKRYIPYDRGAAQAAWSNCFVMKSVELSL